jgi:hypothetical protein
MVSEVALQRPAYSALASPIVAREPSVPYQALNPALAQRHRYAPSAFLLTSAVEAHALRAGRSSRIFFCGRRGIRCRYILSHRGSDGRANAFRLLYDKNIKPWRVWKPRMHRTALRRIAQTAVGAVTVLAPQITPQGGRQRLFRAKGEATPLARSPRPAARERSVTLAAPMLPDGSTIDSGFGANFEHHGTKTKP